MVWRGTLSDRLRRQGGAARVLLALHDRSKPLAPGQESKTASEGGQAGDMVIIMSSDESSSDSENEGGDSPVPPPADAAPRMQPSFGSYDGLQTPELQAELQRAQRPTASSRDRALARVIRQQRDEEDSAA